MTMGFSGIPLYLGLFVLFNAVAVECKNCPPPYKVYDRKPVCRDDYDCKQGKLCCPNGTGFKSCAEPQHGANIHDKYKAHHRGPGGALYCGNTKCSSFQKCVTDKYGRPSCK